MTTGLILGAGFSKWAAGLPLVSELFDFRIITDNAAEFRRIERLKKIFDVWSESHPDENVEAFIRFAQGPIANRFNLVNWYITRRLSEPFIGQFSRRFTWYINSRYAREHPGVSRARAFLTSIRSLYGIVTTNYDFLIEYALGTKGFNYGEVGEWIGYAPAPYRGPAHLTGLVKVAKIHGSVSWDASNKYPDQRCGLTGKCLIVPPAFEKREMPLLAKQWRLAEDILGRSDHIIAFGFAFNAYDQAVFDLVKRKCSRTRHVTLVDIRDFSARLGTLFPAAKVEFVDAGDADLLALLRQILSPIAVRQASFFDSEGP